MNQPVFEIGQQALTLERLSDLEQKTFQLRLHERARDQVMACRAYLNRKLEHSDRLYYGINTGFGSLCDVRISADECGTLQENLVMSHACGMGDQVPEDIVRWMLFLKVQSLSYGHSGVDVSTVWRLIDFFNNGIHPLVYTQGSLGASGDLAPLAHLCLPLIGKGTVQYRGDTYRTEDLFPHFKWNALKLQSKEGLALLNGTQFMSAYAVHILIRTRKLLQWCDVIAALSCDAFDCKTEPFNPLLHNVRPHAGQMQTAKIMLDLLRGSALANQTKKQVQDPYSFRCIPQVHGASKDAIAHVERVVETEINAVTDNPNVFAQEDEILSGGNFHGQPLALNLDYLAIALSELGSISERRTYQLISGQRGLPAFLIKNAGLNSGMMIPQYTAASISSQNKQLCTPASVDSIVSSNGQEDHVSMGANAATKCLKVLENTERILAIELLNAAQALEFRRPTPSSAVLEQILADYRTHVTFNAEDRVLHDDMQASLAFILQYSLPKF